MSNTIIFSEMTVGQSFFFSLAVEEITTAVNRYAKMAGKTFDIFEEEEGGCEVKRIG